MFQDDAQAARALRALLATQNLQDLWTPSAKGPSQSAIALRRDPGRSLSPAQTVLLQAAWMLWDRSSPSKISLDDMVRHLDRLTCEALFSLVLAYLQGPEAVDAWLASPPAHADGPPAPTGEPGASRPIAWTEELGKDWPTLDLLSLRYIRAVIEQQQGNQARAAEVLGVDRRTLSRVLAKARSGRVPAMQTRR